MAQDLIVVIVFVLVFAGIAAFAIIGAKRRREAIMAFATARGWRYAREDRTLVGRFPGYPFESGYGRRATNVLLGEHDGRHLVAFDYQYKERRGSGDDRKTETYHFGVVVMSVGAQMPALSVTPENFLGRAIGRLTGSDIELESEEFNRAFTVRAPDPRFAYDVLHPQMMELLLQWPDLAWRFAGADMISVRRGTQSVEEIDRKVAAMDAILDRVPEIVWRAVRGR